MFEKLVGKKVSILITGKGGKKETYMGTVESIEDNFLVVKSFPNDNFEIDKFMIRMDLVESVWIFKKR